MSLPVSNSIVSYLYDNPDADASYVDQDEELDELAQYVRVAFRDASDNKRQSGIQSRINKALYSKNRRYSPEDEAKFAEQSGGVCIHMGIVAHICRGAMSWMVDVLANSLDKPYTLQPTPLPELPEPVIQVLIDEMAQEIEMFGDTPDLAERAKEMEEAAREHMLQLAKEGVAEIEKMIDDQLTQAQWRKIFIDFIDQLMYSPTAIIVGPEEVSTRKITFKGNKPVEVDAINLEPYVVSATNAYPSSDSSDWQTGEYVIITEDFTYSDMYSVLNMSGVEKENVEYILDNYLAFRSSTIEDAINGSDTEVEDIIQAKDRGLRAARTTTVYKYYGKIPGHFLAKHGIHVEDKRATYESIVWVCRDLVIRTSLNSYPLQSRPIFGSSVESVAGSPWGNSYFDILEDVERAANAAVRSLVKNMAFSSGPIGEVDTARFSSHDAPDELTPYTLYRVDPDYSGQGQPAIRYFKIPSVSGELMSIFERFAKQAEELSGIPGFVLGQPEVAGAGRTLGGLSMLMGNAAKGIKMVITTIDKNIIEPLIEMYYLYNILFMALPTGIVFDAQVVARGSNGILQKELSSGRAIELLQILMPFVQAGLVPSEGVLVLLKELVTLMGFDGDKFIPTQDNMHLLLRQLQSAQPGTPPPVLDGRSAPANNPQSPSNPINPAMPSNVVL